MKKIIFTLLSFVLVNNSTQGYQFTFSYPKTDNILESAFLTTLKDLFGLTTFVETGTYNGDTTACAAPIFKQVHTIELSSHFHARACERFAQQTNVAVHLGDSQYVLPQLLPELADHKMLFWLDGHYSAGTTAKGETNTPILQELDAIHAAGITDAVIMIDDIRFFQVPAQDASHTPVGDYPNLITTIDHLKKINPNYVVVLLGDILLAFEHDDTITISPLAQACTKLRLLTKHDDQQELEEVLAQVINAQGSEKEALCKLFNTFGREPISEEYGFNKFYVWWYSLVLQHDAPESAAQWLAHAKRYGLPCA
ncbi:hypothetical protein Noda2021_07410 [Candidatus Dependentiae bacterium Noda2021]|nr:hypothetical protein Noda2021_07410 [Candidatus Dependentiae bacterium Noda2021]